MRKVRAEPGSSQKTAASQTPTRERILNAAFSAFIEKGYANTSTLEIATRAKVSKRELYALCPGKNALLRDAIAERAQRMRLPLELPTATDRETLAATLSAFGTAIMRGVCEPAVLAVYWLAIAEARQAPEVARLLDNAGRAATRAALARTLGQAQKEKLIRDGDPAAMVADFFALLWGDLLLQLLLRLASPPSPQAMQRKAREATEKFMRLYSRPDSSYH
jgi:AcrR family transcriptional regulator